MDDSLLATKLHLPILHQDMVHRAALVERLNTALWQPEGFSRKLTLVSAPAGFGKTTLVSEWLHGIAQPPPGEKPAFGLSWLSLDEGDNDPNRFLAYLIAAIRLVELGFGARSQSLLQLQPPPPPEVILTSLVNELSTIPQPFILVLDDYHAIHTPSIHQHLAFILEHQPANMHLVILTREDPLLPVARLRARRQLLEIRQDDLRFTQAEAAEFLRLGMGRALSRQDVTALERATEGWVAGLNLALLSMRGSDDPSSFIRDFTASDRYILDYLVEEVFERQPAEVQNFLLQTSILMRLNGSLCDAVLDRQGSVEVLRSLEKSNLFIVPLDPSHVWYRYHHLFAELLHHHRRLRGIADVGLHQRASQWYEAQGFPQEAVEHSLLAQDWGNAARLIGIVSEGMLKHGESVTMLGWFRRLPQEVTFSSPELCLLSAWAALLARQLEIAIPLLNRAEQMAPAGSPFLGQVASAQAFMARSQRDNARTIEKSEQALALLPEDEYATRGLIAMNLGLAYWHEGHLSEAEAVLLQTCDLCRKVGNDYSWLTAQLFLAKVCASRGKLHRTVEMAEELIRIGGRSPLLCLAYYDLAVIHHEWNDLPKAMEYFEQGFALSLQSGNVEFVQAGHLQRAILAHAQGDDPGALAALAEADAMGRDLPDVVRSRTAAFGVQLALACNDRSILSKWSAQVKADVDSHSFYRFMGLTRPRLLIAEGKKDDAARILVATYQTASQAGWGYGVIVVRILQSLAAKNLDEAMDFLADALSLGEPEGFIRSFVDNGAGFIPLLQEAIRRGIEPEYAGLILGALGVKARKGVSDQFGLVEPLSEREIEVLRLVMMGLSNREIASRLFISPGTAKTHIHNLCGKLGVTNRTEAAMRGRELDLG